MPTNLRILRKFIEGSGEYVGGLAVSLVFGRPD